MALCKRKISDSNNNDSSDPPRFRRKSTQDYSITGNAANALSTIEVLETPDSAKNDKKTYRTIRLPNGLTALLISRFVEDGSRKDRDKHDASKISVVDGETDSKSDEIESCYAECHLAVDVGTFSDPRDVQGLAHFIEHMIFMGSEKYPNENDFEQYVQNAGGFFNANTHLEETIFYFGISEEYLDGALDRFSEFLKAPLMLKEAMTRERESIESEFLAAKSNEISCCGQFLWSLGEPTHPCSIFSWGNSKTLKDNIDDDVLHKKAHDFWERHYSAHRMYICLLSSSLSLDDLQDLADKHFSSIRNNQLPGDDFSQYNHLNAFQPGFYENVYFVQTPKYEPSVQITWCLEPMIQSFKTKPADYVSFILSHRSDGSLLSYLRKRFWAFDLKVGIEEDSNSLFSLFSIWIALTEDGFTQLEGVLNATYAFLKFLQMNGPNKELFDAVRLISENRFHYNESTSPGDKLVVGLKRYPSKYVLTADSLYFEYDPNAIRKLIDEINCRRFNIMITSSNPYDVGVTFESNEPWFGTRYTERQMPQEWIELWDNAKPFEEFSLPSPNPFVADDFTILEKSCIPKDQPEKYPTKILDNDLCELWFREDDKFLLPTACYNFYFITPLAIASSDNMIFMSILSNLLKDSLDEKLHMAKAAGLKYSCSSTDLGLVLKVSGFNEKLHLIVEVFTNCLKSLGEETTEKKFRAVLYRHDFDEHDEVAVGLYLTIVGDHRVPFYVKNESLLASVKFADFQRFCHSFCQQMRVKALMQGNISKTHAQAIMQNVLDDLDCGKILDLSQIQLRSMKIPNGSHYLICRSACQDDVNTYTTNFYQIGPTSLKTRTLIQLLMLIAWEPFFDTLRNREQLGYNVSCEYKNNCGILSYSMSVVSQESKHSAEYVDERIERFRWELLTIINEMSDEKFGEFKASLKSKLLKADQSLRAEVSRHWARIVADVYDFDRNEEEVKCLPTITKAELLDFYRASYGDNQRKLSVQVIGYSNKIEGRKLNASAKITSLHYLDFDKSVSGNFITNLTEFKSSLEVYPVDDLLIK